MADKFTTDESTTLLDWAGAGIETSSTAGEAFSISHVRRKVVHKVSYKLPWDLTFGV